MPSFSTFKPFRRLASLALTLGLFGLAACGGVEEADGCQDCGPNACTDPTACTNGGVEIEVQKALSGDEAASLIAPLRISVSFEQYSVAYSFDNTPSEPGSAPFGPCVAAGKGTASPELCWVAPDGSLHVVARSNMLRDYDEHEYVVGVSIEDGAGKLMFADNRRVALDPIWAPGCRPSVDPAYCGRGHLVLTR